MAAPAPAPGARGPGDTHSVQIVQLNLLINESVRDSTTIVAGQPDSAILQRLASVLGRLGFEAQSAVVLDPCGTALEGWDPPAFDIQDAAARLGEVLRGAKTPAQAALVADSDPQHGTPQRPVIVLKVTAAAAGSRVRSAAATPGCTTPAGGALLLRNGCSTGGVSASRARSAAATGTEPAADGGGGSVGGSGDEWGGDEVDSPGAAAGRTRKRAKKEWLPGVLAFREALMSYSGRSWVFRILYGEVGGTGGAFGLAAACRQRTRLHAGACRVWLPPACRTLCATKRVCLPPTHTT